ncbi:MAG TPA: hypothetical protein VM452_18825 [Caulifigura sp.]|nr:hypothetical protein [Caulifigura sp.]
MRTLKALWRDESGLVLSAEAVAVGTLGVVGAAVGAGAVARSVNAELEETAFALRSLDQSFSIPEQRSHGAFVAGSSFTQKPVKEAHEELRKQIEHDRAAEEEARLKAGQDEKPTEPSRPAPKKKKKGKDKGDAEFEPATYAPGTI